MPAKAPKKGRSAPMRAPQNAPVAASAGAGAAAAVAAAAPAAARRATNLRVAPRPPPAGYRHGQTARKNAIVRRVYVRRFKLPVIKAAAGNVGAGAPAAA